MSSVELKVVHNGVKYSGEIYRIKRTMLGTEDHGIFTAYLHCEGDGSGIGLGGLRLDQYSNDDSRSFGTSYGMDWLMRVIETVGVDSWEKLVGARVIGLFSSPGHWGQTAVGLANVDTGRTLIWAEHLEAWKSRG